MNNTPPPLPKKGSSVLAKLGCGCGILILLVVIGVSLLGGKYFSKIKDFAEESQKSPTTATAKLIVAMNPDLELVKADEATKEITIKDKKTGETVTMSLDELKQGKFKMTDGKGNETTVDASKNGKGEIKVKNADGTTVIGGDAAANPLPSWIPAYPGATVTPGGMHSEKGDKVSGISISESPDAATKVKEFYETKLKEAGFKIESALDTPDSIAISATKEGNPQNVQMSINHSHDKTTITCTYEGPK